MGRKKKTKAKKETTETNTIDKEFNSTDKEPDNFIKEKHNETDMDVKMDGKSGKESSTDTDNGAKSISPNENEAVKGETDKTTKTKDTAGKDTSKLSTADKNNNNNTPNSKKAKSTKNIQVNKVIEVYFQKYVTNIENKNSPEAIRALGGLFTELSSNKSTPTDLMYIYQQFKKNKDKLLNLKVALREITILRPTVRSRVEILFTLYHNLVIGRKGSIDFNRVRMFIPNEKVINWFASKLQK